MHPSGEFLEHGKMNLIVETPDDLVGRLNAAGGDLSRRALEALALEEYKSGHITKAEMRRLLGFSTRYELDGFLKTHEVYEDYTMEDFERDRDELKKLGF
jgi:predicted HTH domain antitoxin